MRKLIKLIAVFAFVACLCCGIGRAVFPKKYSASVSEYAAKYGVSEELVYAVIKAESNFEPDAVSKSNAFGLMQLMPATAEWICGKINEPYEAADLADPDKNIRMGCYYLSYLLAMYRGNEVSAIAAYNAGHAHVDSWLSSSDFSKDGETLSKIPFPETEKYVSRVLRYEKIYDNLYGEETV